MIINIILWIIAILIIGFVFLFWIGCINLNRKADKLAEDYLKKNSKKIKDHPKCTIYAFREIALKHKNIVTYEYWSKKLWSM